MASFSAVSPGRDFSSGSERNPLKMRVAITWRRFQRELKTKLRF